MEATNGDADSSKNEICLSDLSDDDSLNGYSCKPKPRMTDQQKSMTSAEGE